MIFQLQLQNKGAVGYRFELFIYHSDNTGGLRQLINGATLQGPHLYERIEAEETIFTTLTIHRGPVLYEYDPLVLGFHLACDEVSFKVLPAQPLFSISRAMRTRSSLSSSARKFTGPIWTMAFASISM
jgi:hypothetical protein